MTYEQFIHAVVEYIDGIDRKMDMYGPKIEAYVENRIAPVVNNIMDRVESVVNTAVSISESMTNTDVINYAAKAIILGAIIDMEHRIITNAESKDWEGIPDTDYELIRIGDHIIATETLDIAELEDDIVMVKAADGSSNRVLLSRIIGN